MAPARPARRPTATVSAAPRNLGHPLGLMVAPFILILFAPGCNNSRYGMTYEQRFPELRRIAVLPAAVEMYSLHSGGVLERRPDMEPELAQKTFANIEKILRERGYETVTLPPPQPESGEEQAERFALLAAVRDAILAHHYEHGEARVFDYETGDAPKVICDTDAHAVLCVYMKGVVPTAGREFLKGTAVVVGVLTGIRFHVSTNQAAIILMLVDAANGDVLWFDVHQAETYVGGERRLRAFVEKACSYLLKPRK